MSVMASPGWARSTVEGGIGRTAVRLLLRCDRKGSRRYREFSLTPTDRVVRFMGLFPNVYGATMLDAPLPIFGCGDAL